MITVILIGFISPFIVIYIVSMLKSEKDKDVRKYFPNLKDEE